MQSIIKSIINEWDPIDVFPLFPEDEYDTEIELICGVVNQCNNEVELGNSVYDIFKEQLGNGFLRTKEECMGIAYNIWSEVNKNNRNK